MQYDQLYQLKSKTPKLFKSYLLSSPSLFQRLLLTLFDKLKLLYIYFMGQQIVTSLCDCMSKQQGRLDSGNNMDNGGFAYETFKKIPFFGPISNYLNIAKNPGQAQGFNPQGMISGLSNIFTPAQGGQFPPGPASFFNIAALLNNIPLGNITSQNDLLNMSGDNFVKKIKKSNYAQTNVQLSSSNQKFTDQDFPPVLTSIGTIDGQDLSKVTWQRIGDIIQNPVFVSDKILPSDILQGSLGDCYFLSAVAALAEQDYRIKNIFPNLDINPNGIYMARILFNGVYQEVTVDDYFPVKNGKPYFAQPAGGKEIWVMVLEKCWAKLYGSYANIVGGLPDQVLHAFSSAPVFYRPIPSSQQGQQTLWNEMLSAYNSGALLCCGTKSEKKIESQGFVLGHAYTLLGVYNSPYKMLKIRNPWGKKQWTGRASDYDTNFWESISPADKQKLHYEDSDRKVNSDGVFFILWQDFITYFALVDICYIHDNASYNFTTANFNHLTPKLFQIDVSQVTDQKMTLALTQQNNRGKGDAVEKRGYSKSFLALGKLNSQTNTFTYVNSNAAKSFPDNYLEITDLTPGKYILYVKYLWINGMPTNPATASIYSANPATIKESTMNPQQFLQQIMYDHASKNSKKKVLDNPNDWIATDILLNKGGFGYFVANVDQSSTIKLSVQLNEPEYTQLKIDWDMPHRGQGRLLKEVSAGNPTIVTFGLNQQTFPSSITLPTPKINRMQ